MNEIDRLSVRVGQPFSLLREGSLIGVNLVVPAWGSAITVPIDAHLSIPREYGWDGLSKGLELTFDQQNPLGQPLLEVRRWEKLGLPLKQTRFKSSILEIVQRLRLHELREIGRLEINPNFKSLNFGELRFNLGRLLNPDEIANLKLRFILAD